MNCPLRGEAEHAPESDESRIELRLEIAELRDLAGLDQLAQLRLDSRANAAHVPHTTRADKLCDRRWRGANELCGPQVRAHCERGRFGELQQRREQYESVGNPRVGRISPLGHRKNSFPKRRVIVRASGPLNILRRKHHSGNVLLCRILLQDKHVEKRDEDSCHRDREEDC